LDAVGAVESEVEQLVAHTASNVSIPPRTQLDTFMARLPKLILFLA